MLILIAIFICPYQIPAQTDSNKGHTEHFIVGMAIGAGTSYFVYRKTNNKFKSWIWGTGAGISIGLVKELIDPAIGKTRSAKDFGYTALGGSVGACIVFPLKPKKKEIAYLY